MAKISELGSITGANTRSEDLLVIVNLVQGDDGTKNITRKELVEAIQYETFSRIKITGGTISGVVMTDSNIDNVNIDNSDIEDTTWIRGTIDSTVITNSTADNITITASTFTDGGIFNGTANNVAVTSSSFVSGTVNTSVIETSEFNDGTVNNSIITDSSLFNSVANNVTITSSRFNDGTGNNVVLTNSTIDDSVITDSTANNVTMTSSTFTAGAIADSTANNVTITSSAFNNGTMDTVVGTQVTLTSSALNDSTAANTIITSSQFNNGTANAVIMTSSEFNDGTGNNVTLTSSTIDDSLITNSIISDSTFTGSMENVVSTNMTIKSGTADGLGANNSTFENGTLAGSVFDGGTINKSTLADFDMQLTKEFEAPLEEESYFAIRNEKTGETEQISYKQLFDEVSKSTAQALKVNVDAASGDDTNPGTMLQPVATLERAFELCLEKAGGELNRNAINNAVHISVGPGTYYTKGELMLPDDCVCISTAGQYATVIEALPGFENNNCILVGSGCYVQGFAYQNWKVDNFDFPEGGFAIAYRPGAKLLRSPYLRDSTQLSNFLRQDVEPPLNPYNSKGTLADLGREFTLSGVTGSFAMDDEIEFSSGAIGFVAYVADLAGNSKIHVRNLKNNQGFALADTVKAESGGTATIAAIGIDDFPNRLVGRGGGCVLADRRVLDPDSLYTYVLCFGFTPRTQNGLGYVARDGAGINGIGSLSIFVRCAFYALNGGQVTLNNSGTQFGDISMRAKGTTKFFAPKSTTATIIGNTAFADTIDVASDDIIQDMVEYLTDPVASGGLGYKGYDADKCERDAGIVLDGTGYDIALNTNYWGRLGGISYRSPISYVVPGDQLVETTGALEYLQGRVQDVFVDGNASVTARANESFGELLNVLKYGEENINPIIWQNTSVARTAARELLQDNKTFVADELMDWIDNNEEFYAYDSASCRRDVSDYILPAVKNDMMFDTNYNAVTAGRAYYMATAKTVMENQNNETVGAYERLKDQTNELIDGDSYLASQRLDDGYDEILDILQNKGTQYTPTTATYDPTTGLSTITIETATGLTVTNATYDPATGIMEATVGTHKLKANDFVWFKPGGITFSCNTGSGVTNHAVPEAHHPYYNTPCQVTAVSATKITMNVGKGGSTGQQVHTFVSAVTNAITKGHGLGVGRSILMKTGGLVFTCDRDNNVLRYGHPRASDPAAGSPIEVLGATASKITVNVGKSTLPDVHTFVKALPNSISILGSAIKWSDNAAIPADKTSARKQLQQNKAFIQDVIEGYVDTTYFKYEAKKCDRDVQSYILPAVERDILTGTNYNAIQTGIAYRSGTTLADNVINEQLVQTTGAMNELRRRVAPSGQSGFTVTDATYDPGTGIMVATIGANHSMAPGDYVDFASAGITFSCDTGSGVTNHAVPEAHHPYHDTPCPITSVTSTTITMNVGQGGTGQYPHTFVSAVANAISPAGAIAANFTPTGATYEPETGRFEVTIGQHSMGPGDYVKFLEDGITFSCDTGSGPTNDAVPNPGHPYFNHPCPVHAVTATTVICYVGTGGTNVHTFVSALTNSVSHVIGTSDLASEHRADESFDKIVSIVNSSNKTYSTSGAAYDPVLGTTVITIGAHDFQVGDKVLIAPDSLTFTCALDGNATQHTYPTTTIASFTPTGATYDPATGIFTATIGSHKMIVGDLVEIAAGGVTFSCTLDGNATNHPIPEPHHTNTYKKKIALTAVDSTTITMNVGKAINGGGTHTFVSALTNAIKGEHQHPLYKSPAVVAAKTNTSITVNVGPSTDTSVHTWISSTADNIKSATYVSTYTPYDATYDPATGVFVTTIGKHNVTAGDYVSIAPESVTFTCAQDSNVTEHSYPAAHHPAYKVPVMVTAVGADSITMNVGTSAGGAHTFVRAAVAAIDTDALVFTDPASNLKHITPTSATYVPASGISVITLPAGHGILQGDYVEFAPYSFTYTCTQDSNVTEHSYPRKGDANYRKPNLVTVVSGNDITVQLAISSGGVHTFVSASKDCVTKVTHKSQGQFARETLQKNKVFLQKEVSSYLDTQYFVFNGVKCSRDSGFIVDSVRRDVATGSTWNSQFMGLGYRTGSVGANNVINDQLVQTTAAINYLKAQIAADPNVTGTALTRSNASFARIIDILTNGAANTGTKVYGDDAALTENHKQASNQLIANRAFMIAEVTAYIAVNYPSLTYTVADCERDTGYLIDSLAQDVRFGGNTCSVNFARLYFENANSVLAADQKEPTYKTWEHIANVASDIVRDITITVSTGNAVTQDVSGTDYGIEVANLARDRVNIVTQAISDDSIDYLPDYIEPAVEAAMITAHAAMDGMTENLQGGVIDYLRDEQNGLPYAKDVCERDVGLIVDAISKDAEYGGNENTLEVFDYYFRRFDSASADYEQLRSTNVLPLPVKGQFKILSDYEDTANVSGLREKINVLPYEQREPTQKAFAWLADKAKLVVEETQIVPTYGTQFTPTGATYDPATGVMNATIGSHTLKVGDHIWFADLGVVFSCDTGSGATNHSVPASHHPYYRKPCPITVVDATSITMNVGTGGTGQQVHTFVSAAANSLKEVTGNEAGQDLTGTAVTSATGTIIHDLVDQVAILIDDVNIETAQLPTLVKATFDPNRTLARKQLQRNRDFIIEEVQGYLKDRYYTFDGDKCKRDVGLLVDAVKADVLTGSNFNSIFNGLAYRTGSVGSNVVLNEQLTETVSGIRYAQAAAILAVTDATGKAETAARFDEIIDIMTNGSAAADVMNFTANALGVGRINGRSQLQNNRAFLIAETTAWLAANRPSHSYNVADCERDLGYLVDAVSFDAQHEGNFATLNHAKLYFENAVTVLPADQIEPTAAVFKHIGDCANLIVRDINIAGLKSAGNALTQNFTSGSGGGAMGAEVEGLFDIVANSIINGTMLMAPAQVYPPTTTYTAAQSASFIELDTAKTAISSGLLAHLATEFEVLPFSEVKCRRDVGYIVDAVSHDIQYGGNAATVQTAGMYFENLVNTGLQIEQRMGSRDAFLHMAKIIEHVVGGKSITTKLFPRLGKYYTGDLVTKYEYWNGIPSYQSTEAQDMTTIGANPVTSIAARKLAEIVANAVDDAREIGTTIPERIDVEQTWMGSNYITSKELIESQKAILAAAVISYLSVNHNALSFPEAKCRRDIGMLVDAISHDVQNDTNFASRQSAGIYFENGVSVLPEDTKAQYADILLLLGDIVKQVVKAEAVTNASTYTLTPQHVTGTAATTVEGDAVHNLIGYIEQVIRANDNDELPAAYSTSTWVATELTTAAQTIDDGTEELASDVTEFINREFTVLDYSKAKCRRDTGYLLDAFSFDLNFGGNTASRWNADFYFWNQINRIPENQREATAKSYRQLGKICKEIVLGEYKGQTVLGELGTAVESKKVEMLANIFYKTQINNDTKYLPVKEEPDYTYSGVVFTDAQKIIEQRRTGLQFDTVKFVNATYSYIDINLTRRDARNLLTALQNDFKFENVLVAGPSYATNGAQNAVRTYTASFFDWEGRHVFPVFNSTMKGLKYVDSVVDLAALGAITGQKPNQAYIVATNYAVNYYIGDIYYWNGSTWVYVEANNTDLLDAFVGAWDRMKTNLVSNYSPDSEHSLMIEGLFNDCLKDNILRPNTLIFGSLVESIAHQFNGASAGVNRNALPLNFRNLGSAISAIASVLNEDGGRIRWSGADELNNQYFARGLKINGRTGRIEGRPFTSSVRKLARRASNSRAVV
jgi:hypothetical protein